MSFERKSAHRLAFDHYLRTGERLSSDEWSSCKERKFNPYHDEIGRFTPPPGVTVSYGGRGSRTAERVASRSMRAKPVLLRKPTSRFTRSDGALGNRPGSENSSSSTVLTGSDRSLDSSARMSDAVYRQDAGAVLPTPVGNVAQRSTVVQQSSVLAPEALRARARVIQPGQNELINIPDLHVVLFGPGVSLVPVPVATFQEFDAAAKQAARMFDLDAVITGPQFDLSTGSDALHGQAIIGGRVYGKSAPGLYYFATVADSVGVKRLEFGKGDPPLMRSEAGFGGGVPLLIAGQEVPGYSQAWRAFNGVPGKGKNIVAYRSESNKSAIFVQPHGRKGYSLSAVRNYIKNSGYDYAIMFDGSGSTSLNYRGGQVLSPQIHRQPIIPLGIGFRSK